MGVNLRRVGREMNMNQSTLYKILKALIKITIPQEEFGGESIMFSYKL